MRIEMLSHLQYHAHGMDIQHFGNRWSVRDINPKTGYWRVIRQFKDLDDAFSFCALVKSKEIKIDLTTYPRVTVIISEETQCSSGS